MSAFQALVPILIALFLFLPASAQANSTPIQLSAGYNHSCLLRDNRVQCWGDNQAGQLNVPELKAPSAIAAGGNLSCAIDEQQVRCWGDLQDNKLIPPEFDNPSQIQLSDSGDTACVLDNNQLKCWGMIPKEFFNKIVFLRNTSQLSQLKDVIAFSLGHGHMCSHEMKGIFCSSYLINEYHHTIGNEPKRWMVHFSFMQPKQLVVGNNQTCVIDSLGLKCWFTHYGQEIKIPSIKNPIAVDIKKSACSLNKEQVKCWGDMNLEQDFPQGEVIAVGENHVCAASATDIACWGKNDLNQLNHQSNESNPWAPVSKQAIRIEPTEHADQLRISFPDYRGTALWKYSGDNSSLTRLPEGKPSIVLANLADTGCYLETTAPAQYGDKAINTVYPLAQEQGLIDCNSNAMPLYVNDISTQVKIHTEQNQYQLTFLAPETMYPYQSGDGDGKLLLHNIHTSGAGRFILVAANYKTRQSISYAPEFLLIDLQQQKTYRLGISNYSVMPSITAHENNFIFSFSDYRSGQHSSFGELWLFNPEDFSFQPIKGHQGEACGPAAIKMVRDRLDSGTDAPMVCGGSGHRHQARFISPTEIYTTYSEYRDDYSEQLIDHLFDRETHNYHRQNGQLVGNYVVHFSDNSFTLKPAGSSDQWPIPLVWQSKESIASNSTATNSTATNTVGYLDGWFDLGKLHLKLVSQKEAQLEKIQLAFNFLMVDAAVTNRNDYDRQRKNESWHLGFSLQGDPLQVSLDNADKLRQSGLPEAVLQALEKALIQVESTSENNGSEIISISINSGNFPLHSLDNYVGLQLRLSNAQGQVAILDTTHTTHRHQWHYFPALSNKLSSDWGAEQLPASIVDGNFTHALKVEDKLYLFSPGDQRFKPYTAKTLDDSWLQTHSESFHALNDTELAQLKSSHPIDKLFYTRSDDFVRTYVFLNEPSSQSTFHTLVNDYDLDGNLLRSSPLLNYYTNCYRYCDESDVLDLDKIALYQLDSGYTLITTGSGYFIFDPQNFRWLVAPGKLADIVELLAAADTTSLPAEVTPIEQNDELYSPFGFYSPTALGEHKILLHAQHYTEPLTATRYTDAKLYECVREAVVNLVIQKPDASLNDLERLECSGLPIDNLQGIEQLPQLRHIRLPLDKDASLEPLLQLKKLNSLALVGDQLKLMPIKSLPLEELSLTSDSPDLNQLDGSHINHLRIMSANLKLEGLEKIQALTTLDLTESTLAEVTPKNDSQPLSTTVKTLIHKNYTKQNLSLYFPNLRHLESVQLEGDTCPASTGIEYLSVSSVKGALNSSCFPQLQEYYAKSECEFTGAPFSKLKRAVISCYTEAIKPLLPALTHLETTWIETDFPAHIQEISLNEYPTCIDDKYFVKANNLKLSCALMTGEQWNAIKISGEFILTGIDNNKVKSRLKKLKLNLQDRNNLNDTWPIAQGYRALSLTDLEHLDIEMSGNFPVWDLLKELPQLKTLSIKIQSSSIDNNFVFQFPKLEQLEQLIISGYPSLDISKLETAPLKSLVIDKPSDKTLSVVGDWKKFTNLQKLQLPYGFMISPAALPCSLLQLKAHLAIAEEQDALLCNQLETINIIGRLNSPYAASFQQQLPATIRRYATAEMPSSVLWVEADINKLVAGRELSAEKITAAEQRCNSVSGDPPTKQGGMVNASCFINALMATD